MVLRVSGARRGGRRGGGVWSRECGGWCGVVEVMMMNGEMALMLDGRGCW